MRTSWVLLNAIPFLLGLITLAGAVAAMTLRNLVHCALSLLIAFAGLAGLYLQLGAQFVGLVQLLVYIGAVGIVLVFAILLTRGGGAEPKPFFSASWYFGLGTAALVAVLLGIAVLQSPSVERAPAQLVEPSVGDIGAKLMSDYVIPLEVVGLLLTAALIGAIVLAMPEPKGEGKRET